MGEVDVPLSRRVGQSLLLLHAAVHDCVVFLFVFTVSRKSRLKTARATERTNWFAARYIMR